MGIHFRLPPPHPHINVGRAVEFGTLGLAVGYVAGSTRPVYVGGMAVEAPNGGYNSQDNFQGQYLSAQQLYQAQQQEQKQELDNAKWEQKSIVSAQEHQREMQEFYAKHNIVPPGSNNNNYGNGGQQTYYGNPSNTNSTQSNNPDNPDPAVNGQKILDAYKAVEKAAGLEFYTQQGGEKATVGALRARNAQKLEQFFDETGKITDEGKKLLGSDQFAYDKRDKEVYSLVPASQMSADEVAKFQRNVEAIALSGNKKDAQDKLDALYGADNNLKDPKALGKALNAVSDESGIKFEFKSGLDEGKYKDGLLVGELSNKEGKRLEELQKTNPDLFNNLVGKNGIYYDLDHHRFAVDTGKLTATDIQEYQRNAPAIKLAIDGKTSEAEAEYNRIHGAEDVKGRFAPKVFTSRADLNNALDGSGLHFNNWSDHKVAAFVGAMTQAQADTLLSETGTQGKLSFDAKNHRLLLTRPLNADDVAALQAHADEIKADIGPLTAPAKVAAQSQQQTAATTSATGFESTSLKQRIAEVQTMLEALHEGKAGDPEHLRHGLGAKGIDGKLGSTNSKHGGFTGQAIEEYKSKVDYIGNDHNAVVDDAFIHRLAMSYQAQEKAKGVNIDVTGNLDQATLNAIVNDQKNFKIKVSDVLDGSDTSLLLTTPMNKSKTAQQQK